MTDFIVIEGLDGSGKATQTKSLASMFEKKNIPHRHITFPDYDSPSSTLVKMYLAGEIGELSQINAYGATSFYASDQYISFKTDWEKDVRAGKTIIADRYATSNLIYQAAKLPQSQWDDYIDWAWDYFFNRLSLPKPTTVIYLDVDPEVSQQLMLERYKGNSSKRDIHESNVAYLFKCRETALYASKKLGWQVINCTDNGRILPIEVIAEKINTIVM